MSFSMNGSVHAALAQVMTESLTAITSEGLSCPHLRATILPSTNSLLELFPKDAAALGRLGI